jgi:2,3-bisphosphoglycerate-dependent phosphoglycerate mutase
VKAKRIVLLRHGQSTWNALGKFTGWTDVPLSEKGVGEAKRAATLLKEQQFRFDLAFVSSLKRAIKTLCIVLEEIDQMYIDVRKTWRLNERHYGALQGLDKRATARKYGDSQVQVWRRSYAVRPPALEWNDERHPRADPRYRNVDCALLPSAESLKDTLERLLPCVRDEIMPALERRESILIVAHGNSLRAFVKYLDGISNDAIANVEIPTGVPLVYEFDERLTVLSRPGLMVGETPVNSV